MERNKIITNGLKKSSTNQNYGLAAFKLVQKEFGKTILEIGAGIGNNLVFIPKNKKVIAAEIDDEYIKILKEKFPKIDVYKFNIEKDSVKFLKKKYNIDTIICFNVLEHIKNDKKAINNACDILPKGGKLILWVPRHKFLYSSLDKHLGHYRRYTKKELHALLDKQFNTKYFRFNTLGVAGWFIYGKLLRRKEVPAKEFWLFNKLFNKTIFLDKLSPITLSYIVICEKK